MHYTSAMTSAGDQAKISLWVVEPFVMYPFNLQACMFLDQVYKDIQCVEAVWMVV